MQMLLSKTNPALGCFISPCQAEDKVEFGKTAACAYSTLTESVSGELHIHIFVSVEGWRFACEQCDGLVK